MVFSFDRLSRSFFLFFSPRFCHESVNETAEQMCGSQLLVPKENKELTYEENIRAATMCGKGTSFGRSRVGGPTFVVRLPLRTPLRSPLSLAPWLSPLLRGGRAASVRSLSGARELRFSAAKAVICMAFGADAGSLRSRFPAQQHRRSWANGGIYRAPLRAALASFAD